ncbi:xyloglucan galactosyltransferase XLT2 [Cicer arietinum]|uniref:Xyloglucan galactosyltransferase XLT2 n=1 Tax=Cicer arietinum TaxID=3827 RepID=A0A1S2XYX5_CICAR|nr:xyloglucan galactosyltransferase XLT2 [Cicer arietinum]
MLPYPLHSSPEPQPFRFSDTKTKTSLTAILQSIFSLQNPRACILFTVLFIQILLLFRLRSFPISIPTPHHNLNHLAVVETAATSNITELNSAPTNDDDQCVSGRVFVYDLPKFFNQEILDNCDNLNPWSSRCDALSNDGFGESATGLDGIIPENLLPAWYWTDQFVSEIIFHNRILNHKCRTMEPESATAFYIPFYAGLAVGKYLWMNSTAKYRDRHCEMMLRWLGDQPHYKKSNGWDHFITMGRITWDFRRSKDEDWGSSCIYKPGIRNITRLLIERNPWDYFDIGIPYPTGFHPNSYSDITRWQSFVRERRRNALFCFAGAPRRAFQNDFRAILLSQCRDSDGSCRAVDCAGSKCSNGTSAITKTFLDSDFCLQPRGDSFTRRSIFDCMVAGSIPVFFWRRTAYLQYEFFLPDKPDSYSVYIDRNAVKNGTSVKSVLESYTKEEVRKMREKVIEYIPRMIYAKDNKGIDGMKDAFDFALEGVFARFKNQLQPGFHKWK